MEMKDEFLFKTHMLDKNGEKTGVDQIADRHHIYYAQFAVDDFLNRDFIVFFCIWVGLRITVIYTINGFCEQDHICLNLNGTKHGCCIGGKIRMSSTSCKERYNPFFKLFIDTVF